MSRTDPRTVLIMGASGASGSAFATAFANAGWTVRRYARGTDPARAAEGAQMIVNALNPPAYHDWATQIPAITELAMTAARASGARVLIPGNVYVFGDQPAPWSTATPRRPNTRKGLIRVQMEDAWRASNLPVTILRAGDFLDGTLPGQGFGQVAVKGLARGKLTAMGDPSVPRAYAWLPDLGRAGAALAARTDLPVFADIAFPGLTFSMTDFAAEVGRQTGRTPRIGQFPWWMARLASPFWELMRELSEMRYLYDHPHSLDGAQFDALLPGFRRATLAQVAAAYLAAAGVAVRPGTTAPRIA